MIEKWNPNPNGRPKGIPNRVNGHARRAIADFVEKNIPRFSGWLEKVANGIPAVSKDGKPILDKNNCTVWVVKPDPLAALKVVGDLTEYHLPKLVRQDVNLTGVVATLDANNLTADDLAKMSLTDLKQLALERFQQAAERGDTIDVEVEPVEVLPRWLDPSKASI